MSGGGGDFRPLLVLHDEKEGHLVYDLVLDDEQETMALTCIPCPVAQFPLLVHWCCSLAVSGGSVLAVIKVGGYDFWERQPGRLVRCWPMHRSYLSQRLLGGNHTDRPAMLPNAGGVVVRMDTVLFDGIYTFEILRRRHGGGGGWHAAPLPSPPVGKLAANEIVFVSAYLALGTRVWISVSTKGTFSLDTAASSSSQQWRMEGTWPLELKRLLPSRDLPLANRGKMTYMWPRRGRKSPYMGFIQPATT
ncbi:hypothetical protein BS78_03G289700 [Paspalum vaginatum]|nr:hypothetical protein BS78_03G289700 [Paspalum vaginatum]